MSRIEEFGDGVTSAGLAVLIVGTVGLALSAEMLSATAILVAYACLFLPYALLVAGLSESDLGIGWLVLGAVAVRVAFVPVEPVLSDDIYRYVWDGRVLLSGFNPFAYAPASDALAPLRDGSIWPNINHPEIRTIYPPGAQYLFAGNAVLGGGVPGMKVLFVVIEAACVAGVGHLLRDRWGRGALQVAFAAYALNPLVFLEVAWSGHLDVVAWGLLVVGLVAWQVRRTLRSALLAAAAIGVSAAVKFLGLLALPLIVFDAPDRRPHHPVRRRLAVCAAVCGILVASYLPMLGAGAKLFSGFGTYAKTWRGNDGGYRAVRHLSMSTIESWARPDQRSDGTVLIDFDGLDGLYRSMGWTKVWKGQRLPDTTFVPKRFAKIIGKAAAVFFLGLAALWCLLGGRRPFGGVALLLFVLYLFAPIVHPWYVAWLVPFAALRADKTGLLFSFTVLAAYLAWRSDQLGGPWWVPHWAVAVEYGLVVVAFWLESAFESGDSSSFSPRETLE